MIVSHLLLFYEHILRNKMIIFTEHLKKQSYSFELFLANDNKIEKIVTSSVTSQRAIVYKQLPLIHASSRSVARPWYVFIIHDFYQSQIESRTRKIYNMSCARRISFI